MESHLKFVRNLSALLDNRFQIMGFKFGFDPLLGLIPGLGDLISFGLSIYIIWIATRMGLPDRILREMWFNSIVDFGLGLIPIFGDVSDFVFKANSRNLKLLEKHSATLRVIDDY